MKKPCQFYKLLFCNETANLGCTLSEAKQTKRTMMTHRFGACSYGKPVRGYLARCMRIKQSFVNVFVR